MINEKFTYVGKQVKNAQGLVSVLAWQKLKAEVGFGLFTE